jgi:parallel beta-helix repeat protein
LSNHVQRASSHLPPDPNAAVRRELARDQHQPARPWTVLLTIVALLAAASGLILAGPAGLLATASSPTWVQDTSSSLHWSGSWTTVKSAPASGGTVRQSVTGGSSVTLSYTGSYLRIIGPTGRGRGVMTVKLDGVSTAVSTHAAATLARQTLFSGAGKAGNSHTVSVTVAGTAGHPLVSLDAFVVSSPTAAAPTATPTPTSNPSPTATPTATPAASNGPTPTPAPTASPTASPSPTPSPSPAVGSYVATNGNDANPGTIAQPWKTLQHAADTATGMVWVRAGTYAPFTLRRNDLTFSSYPRETARVSSTSAKDMIYILKVNGATFENLSVQGGIQVGGSGFDVASSSNVVIRDNTINSSVSTNHGFGIRTWYSTNVTISQNDISQQAAGIQVSYTADGVKVLDNTIHDNNRMIVNTTSPTNDDHGANGVIFLETTGQTLASGNQLYGNRAASHDYVYDGSAFEIYGASDVTITDNTMWNNKQVMETGTDGRACNDITFTRNVAWSATTVKGYARGVLLACASNSLIAFNTLDGFDISDISIVYNAGYKYQGSLSGLKVVDNVLLSNGDPIYHFETPPSGVTVNYNDLWNRAGTSIVWDKTHAGTTSWATFRSWYGYEANGMDANPMIDDLASRDYQLESGSPAINAGSVISGVSSSYLGSAPDIGAYENR